MSFQIDVGSSFAVSMNWRSQDSMKIFTYLLLLLFAACSSAEGRVVESSTAEGVEFDITHVTVPLPEPIGSGFEAGWTTFEHPLRERTFYVSSSDGRDSWTGVDPKRPKRTIAAAKELLRDGHADTLLLKRGDRFEGGLGQWKKSGRHRVQPMLVSSYGESKERPVLLAGDQGGLMTHGGGGSPPRIDHVAIVGLHFLANRPNGKNDASGVSWHQPSRNFLIEDCVFERFSTGLVIQAIGGRHENFRLRRSVVVDSFNTAGGNPQGIYIVHVDGVLIEECVFDQNGWMPGIDGAGADIFSHNLYIDTNNSGVVVRDNIIASGASHGIQMRSGGLCEGNLLVRNSIALMMAGRAGPRQESAIARDNVILDGKNIDEANPRGWGIDFNDIVSGEISGNVIANNGDVGFPIPLMLNGDGHGKHVHKVEVTRNVISNWRGPVQFLGDDERLSGIVFTDNVLQAELGAGPAFEISDRSGVKAIQSRRNRISYEGGGGVRVGNGRRGIAWWLEDVRDPDSVSERTQFTDPDRSVASWNKLQGGEASHSAFMSEVRKQSRSNWREKYTARAVNEYVRAGFDLE